MAPLYRNHACRLADCSIQGLRTHFLERQLRRVGALRAAAYHGLAAVFGVSPAGDLTSSRADGSGG
jgi:hypothetical protein